MKNEEILGRVGEKRMSETNGKETCRIIPKIVTTDTERTLISIEKLKYMRLRRTE